MRVTPSVWVTAHLPWLTLFLFCVTYALRKKKQLSIKHITQHTRKRWQYSVRRFIFALLLRINKTSSKYKGDNEARGSNHCCLEKTVSITYSVCLQPYLSSMQCACAVLYCHCCLVWLCHIFSTLSHERHDFRENFIEYKTSSDFLHKFLFCRISCSKISGRCNHRRTNAFM